MSGAPQGEDKSGSLGRSMKLVAWSMLGIRSRKGYQEDLSKVNPVHVLLVGFVSVLLLVFVPMLLPAAKLLGVDLVHFGVLVVLNMMIGLIHPPFGMLLFVTKALTGIPIGEMMREGWMFLVMLLTLLVAITVFPQIVLWLPQTMGYGVK